jgi:signal transduction histidine kinase
MSVPLLRDGQAIGTFTLWRHHVEAFTPRQLALVETFADQAVIAIQNVKLFNDTQEALDQQIAISEILRVTTESPANVQPVLDAIADHAVRLCNAASASLFLIEGDKLRHVSSRGPSAEQVINQDLLTIDRTSTSGRAILDRDIVHVEDMQSEAVEFPLGYEYAHRMGHRTIVVAPLFREGKPFGTLMLRRTEVRPFNAREIALLRTFGDQAAIALENVRLFHEIEDKSLQLEEASQHKSQFLASMSHELRTPLNAILGFNEMILDEVYGEVPSDMREPLQDIQDSGKHLLRLINNVLDLAKIEAGRMELALADYAVHDLVESVRATLRPLAAGKGLEFVATLPDELPLAYGDSGRLTQCLMNLASNSLKFTSAGRVEISIELHSGTLVFRVTDTGIGIPADKIDSLFTEFKQTDTTIASEYGGTGLGLSISRKFVEMHGGRIWVESEVGRGSMFSFEVPLRVVA